MSKNDVVGLLSRLTIHVDEELKRSVSYTPWLANCTRTDLCNQKVLKHVTTTLALYVGPVYFAGVKVVLIQVYRFPQIFLN